MLGLEDLISLGKFLLLQAYPIDPATALLSGDILQCNEDEVKESSDLGMFACPQLVGVSRFHYLGKDFAYRFNLMFLTWVGLSCLPVFSSGLDLTTAII